MAANPPKFDIAISFLSNDLATATAVYQNLSRTLKVFFFPRNQEDLAGTDGMVTMKETFRSDCRLIVVIYREGWGATPWTRIEETAIQEACLKDGWAHLFFIVLDQKDILPPWLPQYHVRLNWEQFGLDEAVGAIKLRALDNGAEPTLVTPARRAEMFAADRQYRADRANMSLAEVLSQLSQVLGHIDRNIKDPGLQTHLGDFRTEKQERAFILTTNQIGMIVRWRQQYGNLLENSEIVVEEYDGRLLLQAELARVIPIRRPEMIRQTSYLPDLAINREYGWKEKGSGGFLSSSALAERCMIQFIDLADRAAKGEIGDHGLY
jgi:hypothetical protein